MLSYVLDFAQDERGHAVFAALRKAGEHEAYTVRATPTGRLQVVVPLTGRAPAVVAELINVCHAGVAA